MLDGDDDDVMYGDNVGPEESTTDIEWAVINRQTELCCFYQIMYYQTFKVAKKCQSTSENLHMT